MRRPLLVLALLATIAVGWAQAALAAVDTLPGGSQSGHGSRLQKLARRVVACGRRLQLGRHVAPDGASVMNSRC